MTVANRRNRAKEKWHRQSSFLISAYKALQALSNPPVAARYESPSNFVRPGLAILQGLPGYPLINDPNSASEEIPEEIQLIGTFRKIGPLIAKH